MHVVSSSLQLKIFFLLPAIYLFLFSLFASHAAAVEAPGVRRVLILHSFGRDFAPYNAVSSSFRTELARQSAAPIEFFEASLETARFTESRSEIPFVDYLRALFADRPPTLMVPFGAPAVNFLQRHRAQLFPGVPMLATAVDHRRLKDVKLSENATAVSVSLNLPGIIENMLHVLPRTTSIAVVIGNSPLEKFWLKELRQELQPFSDRVQFTWLNELSFESMRSRLAALPTNSAIFYAILLVDAAGVPHEQERALEILRSEASAPIFGVFDSQLGRGILGGPLYPTQEVSRESVRLALRILNGESPSSMQPLSLGPATPVYDWRELKRWGVNESRLPPGSIVEFREPTFWESYKWPIIFVLAICILEAILIDILIRERRRRRLAQQSLEERLRFEQLVSELSGTFINLPPDKVESGIVEALGQVASLLRFDIAHLSLFTGRGTEARIAYIWRSKGVPEIPSDLTDKDFPWSAQELLAGREVCLRSLEMLPVAARTDRDTYEKYRVRSSYSVPLVAGGKVIGVLSLNTVWEGRDMPQAFLQRQRLLGEIFANALARKTAEESLQESEQNFRRLVETTAAVPWQADVQTWIFTYVGPQAVRLLGYPQEQWYEKDFWVSHLHPDDKEFAVNTCLTNSEIDEDFEFEYRMIAMSGKIVWVHDIVTPEHQDGKPAPLRGFFLDITKRKQAEQALSESEERFRMMADTAPVMIWMSGTDQLWSFFNKGWLDFTGRTVEQELGNGWLEGIYSEDVEHCLEIYRTSFGARQEFTMEYRLRRHDGEYCWILNHGVARFEHDGTFLGYIGTALDITERKQTEELVKQERSFLRQVIDINPNFIFAKNREGRFTLANRAVADAYGTTVENLIGKTDAEFNSNAQEVEFFRRIDVEVIDTLKERLIPEERITDAQGRVRLVQTVKRPILEKDGSARQVLGAATDITKRKEAEAELRQRREELAHVTRISAMGELAASLAHELNQPLTAILSNAQAAQRFLSAQPANLKEVHEILEDIVADNSRAGEVIRRMRALVKKEQLEFTPVNLASVIGDVVQLVHSDGILRNIRIELQCPDPLPNVLGDRVQLQQVVLNLLLNAFEAMKEATARERNINVRAQANGAGTVEVSIRDHGTGLPRDGLARIFQPFYTTKRDGLGMGLSISRSIVETHGGQLWAENNSDLGATFYFTLPAINGEPSLART